MLVNFSKNTCYNCFQRTYTSVSFLHNYKWGLWMLFFTWFFDIFHCHRHAMQTIFCLNPIFCLETKNRYKRQRPRIYLMWVSLKALRFQFANSKHLIFEFLHWRFTRLRGISIHYIPPYMLLKPSDVKKRKNIQLKFRGFICNLQIDQNKFATENRSFRIALFY